MKARIRLLLVSALALAVAIPGFGHVEDFYDSVHFHSGQPDFGTPPRPSVLRGEYDDRPLSAGVGMGNARRRLEPYEQYAVNEQKRRMYRTRLLAAAERLQNAGQWRRCAGVLEAVGREYGWRGSLHDRLEVLRRYLAVRSHNRALVHALQRYLRGMAQYEAGKPTDPEKTLGLVANDPGAGFLREHAVYQIASLAYERRAWQEAIGKFRWFVDSFAHSPKREPALIMLARCAILPKKPEQRNLTAGMQAVKELLSEFPHTRFRNKAIGLMGRVHFLNGRYGDAAHCYLTIDDLGSAEDVRKALPRGQDGSLRLRMEAAYLLRLSRAKDYYAYSDAVEEVNRLRKLFTPVDAYRFSQMLLRRPDLISPYLYFRLYHTDLEKKDLANLGTLAVKLIHRFPETRLAPEVRIRLAEVFYQQRKYGRALEWSNKALGYGEARDAKVDAEGRGLFVRGATLQKLGRVRPAIADFQAILAGFPNSPLRRGAREELAILYESAGALGNALDQYFTLDYFADVAFLLDCRMSIPQIETWLRTHPENTRCALDRGWKWEQKANLTVKYGRRDLVTFSLGMRYLRRERWREAARTLRSVPRAIYAEFRRGRRNWADKPSPDPLTAIRQMSRLQRAVVVARTPNARAAALYRYATYYYTHGTLLLYNPALWGGDRMMMFDFWWNPRHATHEDDLASLSHHYEHDVYARALALCKLIAERYAHTPTAPRALYRAACSSKHLAGFNAWWREEDARVGLIRQSARLMKRLARLYPRDPLAHSARKFAAVFGQDLRDALKERRMYPPWPQIRRKRGA